MGGNTTTQSPLRGAVRNEGGTSEEVAGDGAKGRKGREGCDDDGKDGDEGEKGDYVGSVIDRAYGGGQLVNGCGPSLVGVPGRESSGGGHVADSGPDCKGEDGLPGH